MESCFRWPRSRIRLRHELLVLLRPGLRIWRVDHLNGRRGRRCWRLVRFGGSRFPLWNRGRDIADRTFELLEPVSQAIALRSEHAHGIVEPADLALRLWVYDDLRRCRRHGERGRYRRLAVAPDVNRPRRADGTERRNRPDRIDQAHPRPFFYGPAVLAGVDLRRSRHYPCGIRESFAVIYQSRPEPPRLASGGVPLRLNRLRREIPATWNRNFGSNDDPHSCRRRRNPDALGAPEGPA